MELTGCLITIGRKSGIPMASRVNRVSLTNSVVIMAAEGMPLSSRETASRMQHEQQDPQQQDSRQRLPPVQAQPHK